MEVAARGEGGIQLGENGAEGGEKSVTLGYKTFGSGEEAADYFRYLLKEYPKTLKLNEVGGGRDASLRGGRAPDGHT